MTLRAIPEMKPVRLPEAFAFEADAEALDRWDSGVKAAIEDEGTISILDVIGEDAWTGGGVTSKRVAAALRSIGDRDVVVDLNSPGGDFFEGVAIYNMLRAHPRRVTVRVLGLAASAASVIAMAGDELLIGKAGFLMVHNAWVVAIGNRHDMRLAAETLEPFDEAMAAVYADRAGVEQKVAARWMDEETWFNGERAVSEGLADAFLPADATATETTEARPVAAATKRAEALFAKAGLSREQRRSLIGELKAGHAVADPQSPAVAGDDWMTAAAQLIETIRS